MELEHLDNVMVFYNSDSNNGFDIIAKAAMEAEQLQLEAESSSRKQPRSNQSRTLFDFDSNDEFDILAGRVHPSLLSLLFSSAQILTQD